MKSIEGEAMRMADEIIRKLEGVRRWSLREFYDALDIVIGQLQERSGMRENELRDEADDD